MSTLKTFLIIGRTGGPSRGMTGKAAEALSFKRLSVTNFASGWIPLIYVGKESQSAAVSPEMPRRVNCILPLVTVSKTHTPTHTHTRPRTPPLLREGGRGGETIFLPSHPSLRQPSSQEPRASKQSRAGERNVVPTAEKPPRSRRLPLSYGCMCLDRRNDWMIEQ